jgi:phosphate transport system substrate-binding protein
VATVVDGSYSIARGLNVYTAGAPAGTARQYIDFALSAEGQKVVADQGFVPLK